jgi:kumamolisin
MNSKFPSPVRRFRAMPRLSLTMIALMALLFAACSTGQSTVKTSDGVCSGNHSVANPTGTGDLGAPITNGTSIGQVPSNQAIHLNISLAVDHTALDSCIQSINDPQSSNYHHYLSPHDIADHFAPSKDAVQQLSKYLSDNGLQVSQTYTTDAALSIDGTVANVEKVFNITLLQYKKGDRTVYAPDKSASLPSDIQKYVASIAGLSTESAIHCNSSGGKTHCGYLQHYSSFELPAGFDPQAPRNNISGDCTASMIGLPTSGLQRLLTWRDLRSAYGLNNLYSQGFDGSGTTIGMVEFDTYDPADVLNYELCADQDPLYQLTGGNPPFTTASNSRIENVVVVPGGDAPDSGPGAGEATLDLEMAVGLTSSKTKIINYYAPNNEQWESSFLDILHRAASDKKVSVLSISYGDFEEDMTPTYMATVDDAMKILAAEGISVFVASGDCAAFGSGQYGQKALSFPASAPWAISVGGTSLSTDLTTGDRQSETVWVDSQPDRTTCQNTWGSGGGLSSVASFTLPSWQKGSGVSNQYSNGRRQVPDVAAAAINISFYYSGLWLGVGGTSAAAPIWATGVDVVNQALKAANKPPLGGPPNIYALANSSVYSKAFTDVTKGNNLLYPATPGWDYPTGWGAPQFDQIAAASGS